MEGSENNQSGLQLLGVEEEKKPKVEGVESGQLKKEIVDPFPRL
jgi:hypothetical protein